MRFAQRSAAAVLVGAGLVTGAAVAAPAPAEAHSRLVHAHADRTRGGRATATVERRVSSGPHAKAIARTQWITSFRVAAAERHTHLDAAVRALSHDVRRYGQQATQLAQLAAIPLTDTTATQRATATRLVASLNDFFGTELG